MTQAPPPDRTVPGLQRRRPAAAGLVRDQRNQASPQQDPHRAAAPSDQETTEPTHEPPAPSGATTRPTRGGPGRAPRPAKAQVNVEISTDIRDQARSAFRAAAYFEGVPTFAQFVENAIRRENERVQHEHNGGAPFEAISESLPAGRPVGGQR